MLIPASILKEKIAAKEVELQNMKEALRKLEHEKTPEEIVLSADDMFDHMVEEPTDCYDDCLDYGKAMHNNGRLERDIELRPFTNAFEKFHTEWTVGKISAKEIDTAELISEYRNLKPLNRT